MNLKAEKADELDVYIYARKKLMNSMYNSMLEKADELINRQIIQTTILILENLNQRYQKLIVVSTVNVLLRHRLFYFIFIFLLGLMFNFPQSFLC